MAEQRKNHAKLLHMEEVVDPVYSDFVEHKSQKYKGCVRWGSQSLPYHTYLFPLTSRLKTAVAFPYEKMLVVLKSP